MKSGWEVTYGTGLEDGENSDFLSLKDLKQLVKNGEGQQLEFKMKVKFPEKIVREMVAFANSEGGTLLLGVGDLGEIAGLRFPDEDQFVLDRAIEKYCFPAFSYDSYKIPLDDQRAVVVYRVYPSVDKPHFVQLETDEHPKCFVRLADKSIQASKEMKQILRRTDEEGVQFTYGETEKWLIQYLQQKEMITLSEFSTLAKIPIWLASRKLVLLVLCNVLKIEPNENQDLFRLK
jgi:predicted HTH transcriptional regulator